MVSEKNMQPIRITSGASKRLRKYNQFSQLKGTSTKVMPGEKTLLPFYDASRVQEKKEV